jgi:hypothetical protein
MFFSNFFKIIVILHLSKKWFCGRVARQSSAKASTAVRIRSEPRNVTHYQKIALCGLLVFNPAADGVQFFWRPLCRESGGEVMDEGVRLGEAKKSTNPQGLQIFNFE